MLLPFETEEEFCEKCSMSNSSSVGKNERVSSLIFTNYASLSPTGDS